MVPGLASVVICAWNNWPDLEMATESALHQSYQPVEVIVVDNSSSDATAEEFPKRFGERVHYFRQPNRDTAGAYNAGFKVSRGEFIQFLDGDDVLAPNKIEKQVEVFRCNPQIDIVYGDLRIFQDEPGAATEGYPSTKREDDVLRAVLTSQPGICPDLGTLFRRRTIERIGPWDEELYVEDVDYLVRAAWAGCRFGHCPGGPMGFARVHPSAKTQNRQTMAIGLEAVWKKALGYVTQEPYRSLVAARLSRHWMYMALACDHLRRREALAKLALARQTSPATILAPTYAAACMAVLLPGRKYLWQAARRQPVRRMLNRLFHIW